MNERYSRQILFAGIGKDGQGKLLNSRVLIVGCGALGAAQAEIAASESCCGEKKNCGNQFRN
jgi:molybdopterin/thiamine biosynthesis adenylyltransferase